MLRDTGLSGCEGDCVYLHLESVNLCAFSIACVAGGSGCARETFCGEIQLDSSPFFSRPARLFDVAFGTEVRGGFPLPPATQATFSRDQEVPGRMANEVSAADILKVGFDSS